MATKLGGDLNIVSHGPFTVPAAGAPGVRCPASVNSSGEIIAGLPTLDFWGVCRETPLTAANRVALDHGEIDVVGGGVIAIYAPLGISAANNRFVTWAAGPVCGFALQSCAANGDVFHAIILPPAKA